MAILKVINLVAVAAYVLLAAATFLTSGSSDAAGEGMAKGFALVLLLVAVVGGALALLNYWATQIIAALILLVPVAFTVSQRYDSYRYSRQLAAERDGSAYFEDDSKRALAAAIDAGDADALQRLLPASEGGINEIGAGGWTLLDVAVNQFMWTRTDANLRAIAFLLEHGADPNIRAEGRKPLITETDVIVETPIFKMLLEHGANPNAVDLEGRPVLWNVVEGFGDDPENLKLLVEAGADPNLSGSQPEHPLVLAARRMRWAHCLLLLDHGADLSLPAAADFWEHFDSNARSYEKYRDAPPEFVALSQHPAVQAGRP